MAAGSSPWLLQSFEGCYGRIQTCIPFGGGGCRVPWGYHGAAGWGCALSTLFSLFHRVLLAKMVKLVPKVLPALP